MDLKLKYNKGLYITMMYLFYIINQSILVVIYPDFKSGTLRNIMVLFIFFNSLRFLKLKLNNIILFFVFICFLSLVFNDTHPAFSAKSKLAFLVIFFTTIGLLIKTKYPIEHLINFKHILNINIAIVILSFLIYFTEIGSYGRGNFSGVLKHSNTLGPIAALVCIERVLHYFKGNKSLRSIIIGLVSFFVLILAGSRGALATLILSFFLIGIYYYRLKFIIWGSGIFIFFVSLFFILKEFNHALIPENRLTNRYRPRTIFEKGFDNTRQIIWKERFAEFVEKPILGSGFSSVNTDLIPENSVSYDLVKGSIQPGSGYLGILSMLGLLGFISFFYVLIHALIKLYKQRHLYDQNTFLIIISILIFVLIHSIFEGYLISPGHTLFFIFWLSISYILNKHEQKY